MFSLSTLTKTPLGILACALLMLATRFHHFGSAIALPDASLAVFFMAGLWFGGIRLFAALLVEAALIDYIAISQFSISDYCISPAYAFLVPTYAALFFAGKWAARFKTLQTQDVFLQMGLLIVATTVAFLISNGSFYLLSGRFEALSLTEYFGRVTQYYAPYLSSTVIYSVAIIGTIKVIAGLNPAPNSLNKSI